MKRVSTREEREKSILMGLVELYLETGEPIGSNTLKENGFDHVSSATIRNYFAKLEDEGLVTQLHTSGGRIPTSLGIKAYAEAHLETEVLSESDRLFLSAPFVNERQDLAAILEEGLERLSEMTGCATLLSSPRFDHDQIQTIKLLAIDEGRLLAVIVTHFGMIHTETLFVPRKVALHSLRRLELALQAKVHRQEEPSLEGEEAELADLLFHELLLRHVINYANFSSSDLYKTGFSKLLNYPELLEASALASSLSLFESPEIIGKLLSESIETKKLTYFIGEDDLERYLASPVACSVISVPYTIQGKCVGAIALLGPVRLPYPKLFALMRHFSHKLSDFLTRSTCAFKITFRQPHQHLVDLDVDLLIEDQRFHNE